MTYFTALSYRKSTLGYCNYGWRNLV